MSARLTPPPPAPTHRRPAVANLGMARRRANPGLDGAKREWTKFLEEAPQAEDVPPESASKYAAMCNNWLHSERDAAEDREAVLESWWWRVEQIVLATVTETWGWHVAVLLRSHNGARIQGSANQIIGWILVSGAGRPERIASAV